MNGLFFLLLDSWIACANNSLPVPVSPRSRTVVSVSATFLASSIAPEIDLALPVIELKLKFLSILFCNSFNFILSLVNKFNCTK